MLFTPKTHRCAESSLTSVLLEEARVGGRDLAAISDDDLLRAVSALVRVRVRVRLRVRVRVRLRFTLRVRVSARARVQG